jgi:SAM-dependent MidA family methyltransferase
MEIGIRRVKELDPVPLPESDPRLVERIASEIRRSGPMTFARFMELALYDPEAGYYTAPVADATAGPGRRGDFLTAPECHPIFGWAIAGHLDAVWRRLGRPSSFVVREHGAGTGALAAGILDGLRRSGSELLEAVRYQAIDAAPSRLERLQHRLAGMGLAGALEPADDRSAPGAILANELLDALPVHRVEGAGSDADAVQMAGTAAAAGSEAARILERYVDLDPSATGREGPFTTVLGPPSTPALVTRLQFEGVRLEPGQPAEVCLAVDDWVARASGPLERGEALLIDYGAPARDLYAPARGSTLRAYHHHRVHADPLVAIGRQDLTAHVDLTAVERAALAQGLTPLGRARQADFLAALGAGELLLALQSEPAVTLESYLAARSALVRMLDPRATGAFAVMALGRGLDPDPPLPGFEARPGPARVPAIE